MKKIYTLFTTSVLLLTSLTHITAQCSGGRYQDKLFPGMPAVTSDVVYGNNTKSDGSNQILKLDIYEPQCDVASNRALVIIAHGGGFVQGTKSDLPYVQLCMGLAQMGYVVASIEYRLGFPTDQYGFNSAIMRGVHDGRAAVRFMRDNALNGGNTWRIDPNSISFGGPSAGGIIALHLAYQDLQSELTMNCGGQPGAEENSLEGTSNNLTSSSSVKAIISISGGIRDLNWIHSNDIPVFLAHGTVDGTVPYGNGSFGGYFPVSGGSTVAVKCSQTGTTFCFKPMFGQDHYLTDPAYADTLAGLMGQFLYHITCNAALDCNYGGLPIAPTPAVSVAITSGANPSCPGSPVTFTATPSNAGPTPPVYEWKVNGAIVGTNSSTYTSSTLATNDIVTCSITSVCIYPSTVASSGITMTVNPIVPPTSTIAITSGENPTCPGAPVTFTATGTNIGTSPVFQWMVNGSSVGTNSVTYSSSTLANNNVVTCKITSNALCVSPTTATSTGITVVVNPLGPPVVSISMISGTNPTCIDSAVTFSVSSTFAGASPVFQWMKNGSNTLTGTTYTPSAMSNGDLIACKITSNSACASPTTATSSGITLAVTPSVTPAVTITLTSGYPACAGAVNTFTATSNNGGTDPLYQWQVNGANVGTNSTAYSTSTLANSDVVSCVLTSNAYCRSQTMATSNAITMTISPVGPTPTVAISLLSGTNPTCFGTPVTFTATSTNGGANPDYQWLKNGLVMLNGGVYTPSTLANGDVISCILTSTAFCASPPTATSTGITMAITPSVVPTVAVAVTSGSTTVCTGDSVKFTATPSNAGTSPTYQWFRNGNPVAGAQNSTFTLTMPADGDVINCKVISNANCASPTTITSSVITITVTPVATVNAVSNIDVCGGLIGASIFSSIPAGATFTWTNSNTAIGLAASGSGNVPSFTATDSSSAPITGTISVTPTLAGCVGIPSSFTITVKPTATITKYGSTLTSSLGSSYQWYLNGQPIADATSQTYTVTQQGDYSVAVSGNVCPSEVITITGIDQINNDNCFSVFPNPNDGNFVVSFDVITKADYRLEVKNVLGQLIYQEILTDFGGQYSKQMDVTKNGKGIYLVSLRNSANETIKKIIVY